MKILSLITLFFSLSLCAHTCVEFPENFFDEAQKYSRRFYSWKRAFAQNTTPEKLEGYLFKLFKKPKKLAAGKSVMKYGAILLEQLRNHLRGLYESSTLKGTPESITDKRAFKAMLNQAWPRKFCSKWWGWVDKRPQWVVECLEK